MVQFFLLWIFSDFLLLTFILNDMDYFLATKRVILTLSCFKLYFQFIPSRYQMYQIFYTDYFRFLGYVDKIGVAFEGPSLASGYGAYIAQVSISHCFDIDIALKSLI